MAENRAELVRWLFLPVFTAAAGWLTYEVVDLLVQVASRGSNGFLRLLLTAYAALTAGFLFAAFLTRLAPRRRYPVAVALVFVVTGVAVALMQRAAAEAAPIPTVLLSTSLVLGAFGYAIRRRGFSDSVSGWDGRPEDGAG